MGKQTLAEQLKELAETTNKPNKMARLREVFDDIENALKAGVSKTKIIELLKKDGLEFTNTYFDYAMHKVRKERRGSTAAEPKQSIPEGTSGKEQEQEQDKLESHDPKKIDQIANSVPNLSALSKLTKKTSKGKK